MSRLFSYPEIFPFNFWVAWWGNRQGPVSWLCQRDLPKSVPSITALTPLCHMLPKGNLLRGAWTWGWGPGLLGCSGQMAVNFMALPCWSAAAVGTTHLSKIQRKNYLHPLQFSENCQMDWGLSLKSQLFLLFGFFQINYFVLRKIKRFPVDAFFQVGS